MFINFIIKLIFFFVSTLSSVTKYFAHILAKFEASFVSDLILLRNIFCSDFRRFSNLTELKFIQCDALTDELLGSVAAVNFLLFFNLK